MNIFESEHKRWLKDKTEVDEIIAEGIQDGLRYNISIKIYSNGKRFYPVGKAEYANGKMISTSEFEGSPSKKSLELLLKELKCEARRSLLDELAWDFTKEDARTAFRIWNGIIKSKAHNE